MFLNSCLSLDVSAGRQYMLDSEVGSNASEGTDLLTRKGKTGKHQKCLISVFLYSLPEEDVAGLKACLFSA